MRVRRKCFMVRPTSIGCDLCGVSMRPPAGRGEARLGNRPVDGFRAERAEPRPGRCPAKHGGVLVRSISPRMAAECRTHLAKPNVFAHASKLCFDGQPNINSLDRPHR